MAGHWRQRVATDCQEHNTCLGPEPGAGTSCWTSLSESARSSRTGRGPSGPRCRGGRGDEQVILVRGARCGSPPRHALGLTACRCAGDLLRATSGKASYGKYMRATVVSSTSADRVGP